MHEMRARARPEHDIGMPEIFRHFAAFQHRAIGDVSRHDRGAIADDLFAHARPDAVAADQGCAFDFVAVVEGRDDAAILVAKTFEPAAGFERNQIMCLAGIQKRREQIVAMGDAVRLLEFLAEFFFERNPRHTLTGKGTTHFLRPGLPGVGKHGVFQVEPLERLEHIGPELNAGAGFAKLALLLEQPDRKTFARKRKCRGQSADTAAGD